MIDWSLHVLVDPGWVPVEQLPGFCLAIRQGGATVVQLRAKTVSTRALLNYGRALHQAARANGLALVVNDRLDLALAIDAEGVHVGQDDMPVGEVRRLAPRLAVGLSAGNAAELAAGGAFPPDYWGIGPVYATHSKPDAGRALGIASFRELCRQAQLAAPVVAIGGIGPTNAGAVWRAGADGLAVISAVAGAPDVRAACRALVDARG
ncbi:MAG: thiamine phosphate synthase [Thermaerobacter sp.]|nr:thiamine phosphate synthase [Thermaerobacter sp.]